MAAEKTGNKMALWLEMTGERGETGLPATADPIILYWQVYMSISSILIDDWLIDWLIDSAYEETYLSESILFHLI